MSTSITIYESSIEIADIINESSNDIHYVFSNTSFGIYTAAEISDQTLADFSYNTKPFNGSYPVYLISTNVESILSSDPYVFSLTPHDNTLKV
tara:strand:+ start:1575 stop:1853 length:279 start_codon:yes stop_codon:yes gene_type:complete